MRAGPRGRLRAAPTTPLRRRLPDDGDEGGRRRDRAGGLPALAPRGRERGTLAGGLARQSRNAALHRPPAEGLARTREVHGAVAARAAVRRTPGLARAETRTRLRPLDGLHGAVGAARARRARGLPPARSLRLRLPRDRARPAQERGGLPGGGAPRAGARA